MKTITLTICVFWISASVFAQQSFLLQNYYAQNTADYFTKANKLNFTVSDFVSNERVENKSLNFALKATVATLPYALTLSVPEDITWQEGMKYNMKTRTLISAGLFIPTIATGYLLAAGDRPPNTALLTVHKLTAASNLVLLDATVLYKKNASLTFAEAFTAIAMNVCFAGTIATGGMLSMEKTFPQTINTIHSVTPWLTVVSSGVLLYLLNQDDN